MMEGKCDTKIFYMRKNKVRLIYAIVDCCFNPLWSCFKIFETRQTRLWETQKSKRVEIVSFEVETKKETGINHQVFRNCAAVLPGFPKPNYLLKVCRAIDFSKLKRNSSWFQYYQ